MQKVVTYSVPLPELFIKRATDDFRAGAYDPPNVISTKYRYMKIGVDKCEPATIVTLTQITKSHNNNSAFAHTPYKIMMNTRSSYKKRLQQTVIII